MLENKIKVLHIFSTLPIGGAEMLMLNIVKNYDRRYFDIVVCCLGEVGEIGQQIMDCGIEVVSFNTRKIGNVNLTLFFKLVKFIKKKDFHIIHTHMYHAGLYGRLAAWLAGSRIIVSAVHNIYKARKRHRMLINFFLAKITDKIIVGTLAVKQDVKRYDYVPENKIEIVSYGIDTDSFTKKHKKDIAKKKLGLSTEKFVLGNVARIEKAKGQCFLIEAVKILKDKGMSFKCLIIGSGRLEKELETMAKQKNVKDNILFLKKRQDLPELFSAMDVFVFPSLWEGLPLALLSAMASGLPVITTHAGGIKDVIVNGEDGIVVPPADSSAIANAIEKISKDPELQKRLAENGRRKVVENYSAMSMTGNLEIIYKNLLNHTGQAK